MASWIAAVRAAVADDTRSEVAVVDEIERRWKEFLNLRRRGELDGVGTVPDVVAMNDRPSLLRLADRLLYSAKSRGRDRVEMPEPSPCGSFDFVVREGRAPDHPLGGPLTERRPWTM